MLSFDGRSFVECVVIGELFLSSIDGILLGNVGERAHQIERDEHEIRQNYFVT